MKSIIQTFREEFDEDCPDDLDNDRIEMLYTEAPQTTKDVIDTIFISLCGYQLKTLIDMSKEIA